MTEQGMDYDGLWRSSTSKNKLCSKDLVVVDIIQTLEDALWCLAQFFVRNIKTIGSVLTLKRTKSGLSHPFSGLYSKIGCFD